MEKTKHEALFVEQSVNFIEAKRILISCSKEGFESFEDILDKMGYLDERDIVFTSGTDYLVSFSYIMLSQIIGTLEWYVEFENVKSIPSVFYELVSNEKYYSLLKNINETNKLCKIFKDICDKENYCILDEDDMAELDEHEVMKHIILTFNIISDTFTKNLFSHNARKYTFNGFVVKDAFIMQEEFAFSSKFFDEWKKTCQKSLDMYYEYIDCNGKDVVASKLLPESVANDFRISANLEGYCDLLNTFERLDHQYNLSNSSNILRLMEQIFVILKRYDYFTELKSAMDKLECSLRADKLPF